MQNNTLAPYPFHLWYLKIEEHLPQLEAIVKKTLCETELSRYIKIKHSRKKSEYLLSRALIRHSLHTQFNSDVSSMEIIERPSAIPLIQSLPKNVFYSLSHSKNLICFAISHLPLGVDVETINHKRDFINSAEYFMTKHERETMASLEHTQKLYFHRVWSAKEAFYKAQTTKNQNSIHLTDISYDDLKVGNYSWHLHESEIENNLLTIVSKQAPKTMGISKVKIEECLNLLRHACSSEQPPF